MFFDDNTLTPSASGENCYDTDLAFATPYVKDVLQAFIDTTPHTDASNSWEGAFEKAFDYLSTRDSRRKTSSMVGVAPLSYASLFSTREVDILFNGWGV